MGEKTYNKKPREAMPPFLLQGLTDFYTTQKKQVGHNNFPKCTRRKTREHLGNPSRVLIGTSIDAMVQEQT